MTDGQWKKFCIVGFGGHASTKLLPAIEANGQSLAAIVSRKQAGELPNIRVFARVEDAVAKLPEDVCFIIASPPDEHHRQAAIVAGAGRDLVVEKPAFVSAAQAHDIASLYAGSERVFVEAFMYRYTSFYRQFLADYQASELSAIDVDFVVPALPGNTFRQEPSIGSSSLFDIGSYLISLFQDLDLPIEKARIGAIEYPGEPNERGSIELTAGPLQVRGTFGVAAGYSNRVTLHRATGVSTRYSPFFYGRPGERMVEQAGEVRIVPEHNAFEAMLATPRADWLGAQHDRLSRMVEATQCLERLGDRLLELRTKFPDAP